MKRLSIWSMFLITVGIGTPLAVIMAQTFTGPPSCANPPCSNVPGVIWNVNGTSAYQQGARMDFGPVTPGIPYINLKSDFGLTDGKAFRVDKLGASSLYMGNWGGAGGARQPLTFGIFGDLDLIDAGQGNIGSVAAQQYCLNGDCIAAWPAGGGSGTSSGAYVQKIGDSMSGALNISLLNGTALVVETSQPAAPAIDSTNVGGGASVGVRGRGLGGAASIGVQGVGEGYGVVGYSALNSGTAVYGSNGLIGGDFRGSSVGVYGRTNNPGAIGVWGTTIGGVGVAGTSQTGTGGSFSGVNGIDVTGSGDLNSWGIFAQNLNGTAVFASSTNGIAGKFVGKSNGVSASGGIAVFGNGTGAGSFGGQFLGNTGISTTGSVYGVQTYGNTAGVSAISPNIGVNGVGATGGNFVGSNYAVSASGGWGSFFTNSGNTDVVYAAYPGYGIYASVPSTDYAFYAPTGKNLLSGVNIGPTGCGAGYYGMSLSNTADTNCTQYNILSNQSTPDLMLNRPAGYKMLFREANGTQMAIWNGGNVSIGSVAALPPDKLQVAGDIRVGTGTTGCLKDADGTILAGVCSSDQRLKKDVTALDENALDVVLGLRPVTYKWRADEFPSMGFGSETNVGLIAQEVEKVAPSMVTTGDNGFKAVHFEQLPFYTIKAVQEQQKEIDALKILNQELLKRIEALEAK